MTYIAIHFCSFSFLGQRASRAFSRLLRVASCLRLDVFLPPRRPNSCMTFLIVACFIWPPVYPFSTSRPNLLFLLDPLNVRNLARSPCAQATLARSLQRPRSRYLRIPERALCLRNHTSYPICSGVSGVWVFSCSS